MPQPAPQSAPSAPQRAPRWRCLALAVHLALGTVLGAAGTTPAAAQVRLPSLGESAADELSTSREKRVGEQIMREVRRDPAYLDDPVLLDYINSLWQPLVQAARARGDIGPDTASLFPYEAFLVRDRSVNAFALPGGYVGVHLGLIAITATPDELASVLAHELAHVTQRHIARGVTAQSRSSTLGLAAMLLGLLVASRANSGDVAQAAIMGGQAAMIQGQLNFSRDMEREADRNGHALLTMSGFSAAGMPAMFEKLDQNSRLNDSGGFPYLRSHPLTTDRIGEARQRVESQGLATVQGEVPLLHRLMQARARVLMDGSVQALRRWQDLDRDTGLGASTAPAASTASTPPGAAAGATATTAAPPDANARALVHERLAALTAAALASAQLRDFDRGTSAWRAAQRLAAEPANAVDADARRLLWQLGAELAMAQGQGAQATQALAMLADDKRRSTLLLNAQHALAQGRPEATRRASDLLLTWLADHRLDASAWRLLAQAAEAQGQGLRAVRAHAEAESALGNLNGAIDRLRAGQRLARAAGSGGTDFIELSVIDARLRDLMAVKRELQAEQRAARGVGQRDEPED